MSRCTCGFKPVSATLDQAKAFVLSNQFRSAEELNGLSRAIKSGQPVPFDEAELRVAMTIGNWNAVVTLTFLVFAILLGLLLGTILARVSIMAIGGVLIAAALAGVAAFRLMGYVDRRVEQGRSTIHAGFGR
jgi:hypothetical protein